MSDLPLLGRVCVRHGQNCAAWFGQSDNGSPGGHRWPSAAACRKGLKRGHQDKALPRGPLLTTHPSRFPPPRSRADIAGTNYRSLDNTIPSSSDDSCAIGVGFRWGWFRGVLGCCWTSRTCSCQYGWKWSHLLCCSIRFPEEGPGKISECQPMFAQSGRNHPHSTDSGPMSTEVGPKPVELCCCGANLVLESTTCGVNPTDRLRPNSAWPGIGQIWTEVSQPWPESG